MHAQGSDPSGRRKKLFALSNSLIMMMSIISSRYIVVVVGEKWLGVC